MSADAFKPLGEVTKEDIRWTFFYGYTLGERLEHRHAQIAEITLNDSVPAGIRTQFDVARNLLLYAWYVYRFTTVAELHAYSTLEMALREKAKLEKLYPQHKKNGDERPLMLAELARWSVERGWVTDAGFEIARQRLVQIQAQREMYTAMGVETPLTPDELDSQNYCKILIDCVPSMRNSFAHGSSSVYNGGFGALMICRDWINQLFPNT